MKYLFILFSIFIISCSNELSDDMIDIIEDPKAILSFRVISCEAAIDPSCQNATPIDLASVYLFESENDQTYGEYIQQGLTNMEGRLILNNITPGTYYYTIQNDTLSEMDVIIAQSNVTHNIEIIFAE